MRELDLLVEVDTAPPRALNAQSGFADLYLYPYRAAPLPA
jgi:hypothetical protein